MNDHKFGHAHVNATIITPPAAIHSAGVQRQERHLPAALQLVGRHGCIAHGGPDKLFLQGLWPPIFCQRGESGFCQMYVKIQVSFPAFPCSM